MSGLGSELCVAAIGVALFALSPVIRGHVSTFNRIIQCVETGNPYIYIFDGKNHGFPVDFPLNLQETPINLMVKPHGFLRFSLYIQNQSKTMAESPKNSEKSMDFSSNTGWLVVWNMIYG